MKSIDAVFEHLGVFAPLREVFFSFPCLPWFNPFRVIRGSSPLPRERGTETRHVSDEPGASATGVFRPLVAFLLASALLTGCTKYPQVEFANLKYVAALRTACSAKNPEWLAQTKAAIDREHAAGTIGDAEHAAYAEIVATAEAGDWRTAEEECVRFQKDQLAK